MSVSCAEQVEDLLGRLAQAPQSVEVEPAQQEQQQGAQTHQAAAQALAGKWGITPGNNRMFRKASIYYG